MDAYNYVLADYIGPNRHYHDIRHINRMLKGVHEYAPQFVYGSIDEDLYYAILFHDVIYNAKKEEFSNEVLSARAFRFWHDLFYTELQNHDLPVDKTEAMILATEHHFDGTIYKDEKTNVLLDLDLLAFGDDYEIFKNTQKDIDKEFFPFYDHEIVIAKRREFLQNILDNKSLKYRVIDPSGEMTRKAYANITQLLNETKE